MGAASKNATGAGLRRQKDLALSDLEAKTSPSARYNKTWRAQMARMGLADRGPERHPRASDVGRQRGNNHRRRSHEVRGLRRHRLDANMRVQSPHLHARAAHERRAHASAAWRSCADATYRDAPFGYPPARADHGLSDGDLPVRDRGRHHVCPGPDRQPAVSAARSERGTGGTSAHCPSPDYRCARSSRMRAGDGHSPAALLALIAQFSSQRPENSDASGGGAGQCGRGVRCMKVR